MSDAQQKPPVFGEPVPYGRVFTSMLEEAISMARELDALRGYVNAVAAFMTEYSLTADFEAYRKHLASERMKDATPDVA